MGLVNGGLLAVYRHEEILKESSVKPLVRFLYHFREMFPGRPYLKIVREILIHQKTCLGATCTSCLNHGFWSKMDLFMKVFHLKFCTKIMDKSPRSNALISQVAS